VNTQENNDLGMMNYECGLEQLETVLSTSDTEAQVTFVTLEARLRENLDDERTYGL